MYEWSQRFASVGRLNLVAVDRQAGTTVWAKVPKKIQRSGRELTISISRNDKNESSPNID